MTTNDEFIRPLTPELIALFKEAVETGRWRDGRSLSDAQKDICLEAIIRFEHEHVAPEQRTGYVEPKPDTLGSNNTPQTIRWMSDKE